MKLDFTLARPRHLGFDGIITNPPFGKRGKLAEAFIKVGVRTKRHLLHAQQAIVWPTEVQWFEWAEARFKRDDLLTGLAFEAIKNFLKCSKVARTLNNNVSVFT
jgi:hypothetical protein